MLKMLTASTHELDDPLKAVRDIVGQLDTKHSLLKNSVALLFCHANFIESGTMEMVCSSLPFDVIGGTTMYASLPCPAVASGESILTVTVLTSDEVEFVTSVCEPLTVKNAGDSIGASYQGAVSSLGGTPDLIFAVPPVMINVPIDIIFSALDSACGGVPIFGTVALDMNVRVTNPQTIYQGTGREAAAYVDRMPLLLIKGPISPRFFSIRFPDMPVLEQEAIITEAEGARLISINNEPAMVFLKEVGIVLRDDNFTMAIPLIIERGKGAEPEVVVVHGFNENGDFMCSKNLPIGGILNVGAITRDYVVESMEALVQEIKKNTDGAHPRGALVIVSCFLRSIVLGGSHSAEIDIVQRELSGYPVPYLYISAGGELCPRYTESGKTANQELQYALVACQF